MGFLQLLKFSLLCVDFLAWPAVSLGYPLFASIRAIETDSKYHMRKLVIYWTIFSLISLFECAFVKIIEWFPFWSSVKLLVMIWLVFPRFHGAYYAYQSFIRPYLHVNLQEVIGFVYKPKGEISQAKEIFLDVADKYIKENGYEALESLIASKMIRKEVDDSQIGTRVIEPIEENASADSKQKDTEMLEVIHKIASLEAKHVVLEEPYNSQMDIRVIELAEKNVQAVSKQLKEPTQKGKEELENLHMITSPDAKQVPHPRLLIAASEQVYTASAKTKDTVLTSPPENEELVIASPSPLKKTEMGWDCHICQVTITCEKNLNNHLLGKKHKSKCESKFEMWCDMCDLMLLSEDSVESHLQGKRHGKNIKRLEKVEGVVVP